MILRNTIASHSHLAKMNLPRRWFIFFAVALVSLLLTWTVLVRNDIEPTPAFVHDIQDKIQDKIQPAPPVYPKPKPTQAAKALPIVDNFPLAAAAHSAAELPPIPTWSKPILPHVKEKTPLFIGFTRNWRLLQQVVVSYITAGWPASDIYVIENTGVLDANKLGQLSLQNPFFLNHTRLEMLGVNVIITPTLLTFAQLQTFYLWTSTTEGYPFYFWSHMDVVAVPFEWEYAEQHPEMDLSKPLKEYPDFHSLYYYCIKALNEVLATPDLRWAMRFFSYDRLALVNVAAFREVGGWDTMIPFYMTDCDMHARLEMAGFEIKDKPAGLIYDVASSLDDLIVLYRKLKGPHGEIPEAKFIDPNVLEAELEAIAKSEKEANDAGLNNDPLGNATTTHFPEKRADDASAKAFEQAATLPHLATESAWEEDTLHSKTFKHLTTTLDHMQGSKGAGKTRNSWQGRQMGGQGDPFYRDSAGFEEAILMTIEHGRNVFREKWGHRDCDIVAKGLKPEHAWRVEHDW